MSIPLLNSTRQRLRRDWVCISLIAYGAMCVGLLGFFTAFPDKKTQSLRLEARLKVDPGRSANTVGQSDEIGVDRYRLRRVVSDTN